MNTHKLIAWLTGILTLLLAGFSFVLSFNALTDLAKQHGVSIPPLFPFVVEFAVIIFSLNALYRSLSGDPAKVQWGLIIGSSLLAGLFNVAHAEANLLPRLMAAMPSLFLLLSFESFLSLVKHSVSRQSITASITQLEQVVSQKEGEVSRLDTLLAQRNDELDTIVAQIHDLTMQASALKTVSNGANDTRSDEPMSQTDTERIAHLSEANDTRLAQVETRREQVLSLLNAGKSQNDIASELKVSIATVKRDTKALNGRVSR